MKQVRVALQASSPISEAGLIGLMEASPEFTVLPAERHSEADVLVLDTEGLTAVVLATLRRWNADTAAPVVLVTGPISETGLLAAARYGVLAILPRTAITAEQLTHSVRTVINGGGVMPPRLVGELVRQIDRLQREVLAPSGLNAAGMTQREVDVLRLMADGLDTNEIASKIYCSERTVKNVFAGMAERLQLRSRSHAVAYALRAGVI
ncbi:response regulator transcription factor [Actinoplanes sp. NPDC051343]|uniref:response regulator transcription factor n=1 Tax=Actinoplanes sp. NPDC051343 TaxID=3363906 RepID=UPI0037ADA9F7